MKARRTMKYQASIQETISQLSQQFVANALDIKKVCDIYTICHDLVLRRVIGD